MRSNQIGTSDSHSIICCLQALMLRRYYRQTFHGNAEALVPEPRAALEYIKMKDDVCSNVRILIAVPHR